MEGTVQATGAHLKPYSIPLMILLIVDVYLFNSSFNGHIDASAELQIAQMYQPRNSLLVEVAPIQQQQPGSNSCGLFNIAAAYHAARGDGVESITFDERKMRKSVF